MRSDERVDFAISDLSMSAFVIDLNERFETLPKAPIVEAIIDIRAVAPVQNNEADVKEFVAENFGEYQFLDSQRAFEIQMHFAPNVFPNPTSQDMGWKGCRFRSQDQKYIARFDRDGFVLSRLEPYESWDIFLKEAMRLWSGYAEFLNPQQINRIGLRYINRIQLPMGDLDFESYIQVSPSPIELDFPVSGFMHQDSVVIPDHPYGINMIKTIQRPNPATNLGLGLILDIDVYTSAPFDQGIDIEKCLAEMRWLKNKVFFGVVTPKSLEMFH